jgi:hypothetical protein
MRFGGKAALGTAATTAAAMAIAMMCTAGGALASPVHGPITPEPYDVVGVTDDVMSPLLNQLAVDYNAAQTVHNAAHPRIYIWNPSVPGGVVPLITPKQGCPAITPSENADQTAISVAFASSITFKGARYPCIDFIGSYRGRRPDDPPLDPGGSAFVALATDAVTYATVQGSFAPDNLTRGQLREIFGCTVKAAHGDPAGTWGALLGSKAAKGSSKQRIDPILPQAGSGVLQFWMETALGLPTDSEPACGTAAALPVSRQPEDNEGVSKLFLTGGKPNRNVVFPFSIGSYIAQAFHSAACGKRPAKGQNEFGCDQTGVLHLNSIAGKAPVIRTGGVVRINPKFSPAFTKLMFDIVRFNTRLDPVSPRLAKFFGPSGYFCAAARRSVIEAYGFLPAGHCGSVS